MSLQASALSSYDSYYSDPDASNDFWSLAYALQGTIAVQASFAVCKFPLFPVNNWYD